MDLLAGYGDGGGDDGASAGSDAECHAEDAMAVSAPSSAGAGPKSLARKPAALCGAGLEVSELMLMPVIDAAPVVDTLCCASSREDMVSVLAPANKRLLTNPSFAMLNKPLNGPTAPGQKNMHEKQYNGTVGNIEKTSMNKTMFDKEYHTFHNFGHAANPCRDKRGNEVLNATESVPQPELGIWDRAPTFASAAKKQRAAAGGQADAKETMIAELNEEDMEAAKQWGGFQDVETSRRKADEDVRLREDEAAREREEERAVEGEERQTKERVTSVFHGARETDYAGKSWIESKGQLPRDIDEKHCYMPKKWLHTWSGHTMGVNQIRWFPDTAHLILSCSMDSTIKIWDYQNQRKCLRTYMGHDQGVRDVNFTSDGKNFYSVSYDKNIQYWDTETGQVIATFTNKKTNFNVAVHPDPSQQNIIICACSNKKAVQWDCKTANIVQEYDEHMGAVNTVTFCEDGKRLLTTSDDKKIFLWEYGIPVVVKYIAEPTMHSCPAVTLCPKKRFLLCQSMDNQIITYEAFGRFKFQSSRKFKGHLNAGYAISPGWSSDGRWVMSGDLDGKLWFWDWAKQKNYRVVKAHDGVCMSAIWHPTQASRVVSCGWDGTIKLWD